LATVRDCIENGESVNKPDRFLRTPLMYGVKWGYDMVKTLLDHKANVKAGDRRGKTPIIYAVQHCAGDVVKLLLEHKADVGDNDNWGQTTLMYAAMEGASEMVKILHEANANINEGDIHRRTPLMSACRLNRLETVKLLVSMNADLHMPTKTLWTPLTHAISEGHVEVARFLVDQKAAVSDNLHVAARFGKVGVARLLVNEYSVKVDEANGKGDTALLTAVYHNMPDVTKFLVSEAKADVTIISSGRNACQWAEHLGHAEVALHVNGRLAELIRTVLRRDLDRVRMLHNSVLDAVVGTRREENKRQNKLDTAGSDDDDDELGPGTSVINALRMSLGSSNADQRRTNRYAREDDDEKDRHRRLGHN